jgi:NAD-dependent SIR2 family protein deacetylase
MANFIKEVIVTGAGVSTSNGTFTRDSGEDTWFYSENGSHIEHTVDGWFLIDSVVDDQTYVFGHNFESVISAGDCIEPVPSFELVYSE